MIKRFRGLVSFLFAASVCACFTAESKADVKLTVPVTIFNFNAASGDFSTDSPNLFLPVTFDDNGSVTSFSSAQFQLSTAGMTQVGTTDPSTSRAWAMTASNPGEVAVVDNATSTSLLTGQIIGLELAVQPGGLIQGIGTFAVSGGLLGSHFGSDGVLETIALSFSLPVTFDRSLTGFAHSVLTPSFLGGEPSAVPEASGFVVWLGLIGVVGVCASLFVRKELASRK